MTLADVALLEELTSLRMHVERLEWRVNELQRQNKTLVHALEAQAKRLSGRCDP